MGEHTPLIRMSDFTPILPPHWKHVIGVVPIPPDDLRTWDEDIFSAEWRPEESMAPGNGWWIWLDGGKGYSVWQCSLVIPNPVNEDGEIDPRHDRLMRDFVNSEEEVQAWLDRAVVIAQQSQEEDDARAAEEAAPTPPKWHDVNWIGRSESGELPLRVQGGPWIPTDIMWMSPAPKASYGYDWVNDRTTGQDAIENAKRRGYAAVYQRTDGDIFTLVWKASAP